MRLWSTVLVAILVASCSEQYGGLTADLVFADRPGMKRQALRSAAVPMIIDRLQIIALADGSTLTDRLGNVIETNLYADAPDGPERLYYEGGEWQLSRVPAGDNRSILARAYLGPSVDPRVVGLVAFEGRIDGITVVPGETKNAGTVELRPKDIKIPEVDREPPTVPNPVMADPRPEGELLRVTFGRPEDAEGYVLAVTSSTSIVPPTIAQQSVFEPGQEIVPGVVVHTVWPFAGPMIIDIGGLTNGLPYTVMVYAYDVDLDGRPLNYSPAAIDTAIPRDTLEPGEPENLAVGPSGNGAIIAFNEPGEDRDIAGSGRVMSYEVRAATDPAMLMDPATFKSLPVVMPPQPLAPGQLLTFERSFTDLRVRPDQAFYVGVRALDAALNAGPIAMAQFTVTATQAPAIEAMDPPIAIAGREITIRGQNFGPVPGSVTLTTTGTTADVFTLSITRWSNTSVVVAVPRSARTGSLVLERADELEASAFLPVVLRIDDAIDDYQPPFEAVGARAPDGTTVISALYREAGEYYDFDAAIERFVGLVPEGVPYGSAVVDPHSTAVAGTYSPAYDRFMFVASTDMLTMSTLFVTSSTLTPDPLRIANGVAAGNADRVSVVFLDGGANGRYPALLAFTLDGAIRTATVSDALLQPFNLFYATTSTIVDFDRVTIARSSTGDVLMAHRAVPEEGRPELWLRLNQSNGAPDAFAMLPAATRPNSGPNFEVVSVPTGAGCTGPEEFVIAYEALAPNGVTTEVRLLRASDYGNTAGYAPLPASGRITQLEDLGLVCREGSAWLALLITSPASSLATELFYTEIPLSALTPSQPDGKHPGVSLDIASNTTRGRVACKPLVQDSCPIVWSGDDDVRVLFVRR